MPERDFKGIWIPSHVWLDERLNALEKVILAEIDSLDGEHGCWASNDYISQFCQCSASKVSKAVSKLTELGYIRVESFNGRSRVLRSSLAKNDRQTSRICETDEQNLLQSNINNKIENKSEKRKRFTPPTVDEVKAYCSETNLSINAEYFVDYYTSKGWKVGRDTMKDWKAAVRNWARRDNGNNNVSDTKSSKPRKKFKTMEINGTLVDVEVE